MKTRSLIVFVLFFLSAGSGFVLASENDRMIGGYPEDQALMFGEKMYREGVLPSGQPLKALVMGDIPVDGRMFTCDDCHQRSGLGSVEGTVITWPTNGKELYVPRRRTGAWRPPQSNVESKNPRRNLPEYWQQVAEVRPAYTDRTLAHLLRAGEDSAGRKLDNIMPRYMLNPGNMEIFVHYLKNLSVELDPGVNDTVLTVATVIAGDVPDYERLSMLSVLKTHIATHNSQTRHEEKRARSGPFYKSEMHKAYRRLKLNIWELEGDEASWPRQLEEYYRQEPVFALLGGISEGSWAPIHHFSEQHKIPCIFPITDLPVISKSDWYTLYFSKGFYQEGEAAAKYLRATGKFEKKVHVVQVFREDQKGTALAEGFAETWQKFGGAAPENRILQAGDTVSEDFWSTIAGSADPFVLLLWLGADDLKHVERLSGQSTQLDMVFISANMIKSNFSHVPDTIREKVYMTYPYSIAGENSRRLSVIERWLKMRKIEPGDLTIQSKMYFLGWTLAMAIKQIRSEFFRDYFFEGFDMMTDQDYAIAVYPRLTFGNGQRYASKGCYIVQITKGENPHIVTKSDWVVY